ncbi:hypothetical protein M0R45_027471 [Rubus argutus]|uniref:Serine-tRNA synthetase type1 N-terminal domain-containing protein n=1 Tax=Rubus argutus TaxID=59490 RepID=A0AAW1X354_RUBAR
MDPNRFSNLDQILHSFQPNCVKPQWKAAIDFKWIRDNNEAVAANIKKRNSNANLELVLELYNKMLNRQKLIVTPRKQEVERLCGERNAVANKMKGKLESAERQKLIEEGKNLKEGLLTLEEDLLKLIDELQQEAQCIPNMTPPDVGSPHEFNFPVKDHLQLGKDLDLFDFEAASEVSGSKFYYLKNEAVMLEMGLINWTLLEVMKRGFTPLTTPEIVRSSVVEKCGFRPRGTNTEVYSIESPIASVLRQVLQVQQQGVCIESTSSASWRCSYYANQRRVTFTMKSSLKLKKTCSHHSDYILKLWTWHLGI